MVHLMFAFAVILMICGFINEKRPSKMPPNAYFDWDEYWKDIRNGMSSKEQLKKHENFSYYKSRNVEK